MTSRHSGESRNPGFFHWVKQTWTPVFTGVTTYYNSTNNTILLLPPFAPLRYFFF